MLVGGCFAHGVAVLQQGENYAVLRVNLHHAQRFTTIV